MTVKINGMTLEEIEAQMKKFKKMEKENEKDFEVNCPMKAIPDLVFFTPREEIEFAKRIEKAIDKAMDELGKKYEEADAEKRKEMQPVIDRLFEVECACDKALNEPKCFGGYFIWNKGDKI